MAYTTINKSSLQHNAKIYSGNYASGHAITGVGFQPDWTWIKDRGDTSYHIITDSVRGATKTINSNGATEEITNAEHLQSFNSDGFTVGQSNALNQSGVSNIAWNWKAGGTAPTKTYHVVVVSDSGNKYRFRDTADTTTFGASAVTLDLQEGGTYTFDVSDSTMNSHPFVIGTAANSSEYSTGVTYKLDGVTKTYSQYHSGFSAATSRQLIITVAASAPALYYWCFYHSGMGGAINTNATFGSSNFDGSKQSLVSANSTSGFSIIKYTGSGSSSTIGHGLSSAPGMIIVKRTSDSDSWTVYHKNRGAGKYLRLDTSAAESSNTSTWANTSPTSTVFSVNHADTNDNNRTFIAYCFAEVTGYCKLGAYVGNGNASGTFTYTGFKPSFVILKNVSDSGDNWTMYDNKRDINNPANRLLFAQDNTADSSGNNMDIFSNGFKQKNTSNGNNGSTDNFIYMAFGQTIVGSNNVPATAR